MPVSVSDGKGTWPPFDFSTAASMHAGACLVVWCVCFVSNKARHRYNFLFVIFQFPVPSVQINQKASKVTITYSKYVGIFSNVVYFITRPIARLDVVFILGGAMWIGFPILFLSQSYAFQKAQTCTKLSVLQRQYYGIKKRENQFFAFGFAMFVCTHWAIAFVPNLARISNLLSMTLISFMGFMCLWSPLTLFQVLAVKSCCRQSKAPQLSYHNNTFSSFVFGNVQDFVTEAAGAHPASLNASSTPAPFATGRPSRWQRCVLQDSNRCLLHACRCHGAWCCHRSNQADS